MMRPEPTDPVTTPAVSGSSSNPEFVAETPVTTCRNSGRKITPPNRPQPVRKPSAELTEKMGSRNRRSGRMGSATRDSQNTKPASSAPPPTSRPLMTGDDHGYSVPPHTSASSRQLTLAVSSAAPRMSMRCERRTTGRCSTLEVTANASAPTGRLIRKTQRHDMLSTMKPPTSGPSTLANAHVPASRPM